MRRRERAAPEGVIGQVRVERAERERSDEVADAAACGRDLELAARNAEVQALAVHGDPGELERTRTVKLAVNSMSAGIRPSPNGHGEGEEGERKGEHGERARPSNAQTSAGIIATRAICSATSTSASRANSHAADEQRRAPPGRPALARGSSAASSARLRHASHAQTGTT